MPILSFTNAGRECTRYTARKGKHSENILVWLGHALGSPAMNDGVTMEILHCSGHLSHHVPKAIEVRSFPEVEDAEG